MKDNNFASADLTMGQINALVKKINGKQKVLDFLAGRLRLVSFFDYKDGAIYLKIENPAFITLQEWKLQLGDRLSKFSKKFVTRIKIAETYHTFDSIELCIFDRPLTEIEMEERILNKPHPNLVFQLQKIIPENGMLLMGFNELLIMHEPIVRVEPGQKPAQLSLLLGGSIFSEGFCGKGSQYRKGVGFVYVKK
jgi:hypothetical protein